MAIMVTLAFLFTGMCAFQLVELLSSNIWYDSFSSLYYIVITFSTVGYGDITPSSTASKILITVLIIFALAYFPRAINSIIETYRTRQSGFSEFTDVGIPFVVVYVSFLRDRFIEDILETAYQAMTKRNSVSIQHGKHKSRSARSRTLDKFKDMNHLLNTTYHIVLMSISPPSEHLRNIMRSRKFSHRVTWIHGSALEEADLKRCGIRKAAACFILADRSKIMSYADAKEEDNFNVLRVWSVKRYAPETPVFVYNLRPETGVHVNPVCRQVLCVTSLKQLILGYSCLYRGSATLITNLIHQAPQLKSYTKSWQITYADGLNNSIILGPFNPIFAGKKFSELTWFLYAEFQVLLIGIHFRVPGLVVSGESPLYTYKDHYILNPGSDYVIPSGHLIHQLVYIAHSTEDVADICCLDSEQFRDCWLKWENAHDNLAIPVDLSKVFEHKSSEIPQPINPLFRSDSSSPNIETETIQPTPTVISHATPELPPPQVENLETVIGHPIPPHHMILDKDLQTPFCHLLKKRSVVEHVLLADATAFEQEHGRRDSVKYGSRSMKLENHVVLCVANMEIWPFMCTMRASHLEKADLKPVLILCPNLPSESEWKHISVFPLVYVMIGNPLKRKDIVRAGLNTASCVVMMRQPSRDNLIKTNDERQYDSTAIMATHQIDFMVKNKHVITELVTKNNIKFMRAKSEMLDHLPKLYKNINNGFEPLDLTENFQDITEKYVQSTRVNTADPGFYAHSAIYASGRVLAGDMFDGILFESFRTEGIIDIVRAMCGQRYDDWIKITNHLNVTSSVMMSVPLPVDFAGESFSTLFRYMTLKHGLTPLAIYRRKTFQVQSHVYTSPIDNSIQLLRSHRGSKQGEPSMTSRGKPSPHTFRQQPLYRTTTGGSISSRHLFNMEMLAADIEDAYESYEMTEVPVNRLTVTSTQGRNAFDSLNRLLNDANTSLDNDLPFLITNPLPDFELDELDHVFILAPKACGASTPS